MCKKWVARTDCLVYRGEKARARCVEIQASVNEMGEGEEFSSSEATLSAYSFSLSLRNRGKDVRRLLLWTLPKK